jgi:hypothetical protein
MAGLEDYLPSFFKPGDISDPRVNPQLRQKIAAALLAKEQRFPKTIGEGLSAIGDAIGQRRLMSEIYQSDIAAQGVQPPAAAGAAPTASTSYGGGGETPPAVAAIDRAITPATDSGVSEGGYNSIDAAANAPQPGTTGTTPGQYANVRFNNPGAAYPGRDATAYGSTGSDTIGGGNRIANFPSPVHGAAANLSLLSRAYTGMPISAAVNKWSGGSRSDVPGFDPNTVLTPEMLNDPKTAIPLMQGITSGEAPGKYPMTPDQWQMAHQWFTQGGPPPGEGGGRNAIAATLATRQQPQPPPAPAVGADQPGQALALTAPPSSPAIAAAPPAEPIRQAPTQVAQAEPQPQVAPGYVPPEPKAPASAPMIQPSPREVQLSNWLNAETARGNRQYAEPKVALELQTLQAERANRQKEADKLFEADVARGTEQAKLHQTGMMDAPARIAADKKAQEELTKARQENQLRAQFGNLPPDEVFKQVNASKTIAKSAQQALVASQNATKALDGGAILGSGANQRLDVAKFFTGMGLVDKGNAIANTEVFKAAMQPIVASILHQTSGTSQLSDNELAFAKSAAAGNITLDPQSIRTLMTIIDKRSQEVLKDHQALTGALFGHDNPQANALFGVEAPKPQAAAATVPEGTTATGPNGARMVRRGGKWEPM